MPVSRWSVVGLSAAVLPAFELITTVVHRFRGPVVEQCSEGVARPGLATVYDELSLKQGEYANGFTLFYDKDTDLMTPQEAMALRPRPELITYQ